VKIIYFLLSLYIAVLSTVSCCADNNCNDEIKTEQSAGHSQNNDDNDCNSCSPFVSCCSCSGFVFSDEGFRFIEMSSIKDKFVADYRSQFSSGFIATIWQPPKIS